ncbi:MAG: hypothetical protein GY844_22165 [Bradyrhizobium sp.]|nr:hypothetical protein [Bradyrhizobium sp.]
MLFALSGPVLAMDQSAVEETNCLMACDANQENCLATGHGAAGRSLAANPPRETLSSRSLRPPANFSQINLRTPPNERLRQ